MELIPMTMAGHKALEDELQQLKTVERHAVIKMIAEARAHGDLSENAEYHAAKDRQSFIEGRMMDLEDKISRAQVIDLSKLSGKTVTFGATVILGGQDNHSQVKYQIVGDLEADLKQGRVSISSPMARALIGRAAGDVIEVTAPGGARSYEILNVSFV
jgi:transcription elongation factor GreA